MFFLFGLFGHLFAARADRRLRDEAGIVSALGSGVLGGIDVSDEPAAQAPKSTVRTFFLGDRPWHVAALPPASDEAGLEIRYRRVLSRLPERGRVLVVVAKDDPAARRAADRLGSFAEERDLTVWEVEANDSGEGLLSRDQSPAEQTARLPAQRPNASNTCPRSVEYSGQ